MVRLLSLLAATAVAAIGVLAEGKYLPDSYIIEFRGDVDLSAFNKFLEENDVQTRRKLDYELFKGVSIDLNGSTEEKSRVLQELEGMPDVKHWSLGVTSPPSVRVMGSGGSPGGSSRFLRRRAEDEEAYSPHVMAQIDKLHAEGITGKGIKVAVIDSGIDYTHPALGGCFGPGCLVSFGKDLVGGNYSGDPETLDPDNDPQDCYGHGTHVAGIIAAQPQSESYIVGAAPGVNLGAYKIGTCAPVGAANDVLIAAFNEAYEDGADIISCSMANSASYPDDPLTTTVSRIVEQGVPCVIAAGNFGKDGLFSTQAPAIGRGVISVGAVDNTVVPGLAYESTFQIDGEESSFPWGPWAPANFNEETMSVYSPDFNPCEAWPEDTPDLSEVVVLLSENSCDPTVQATFAAKKGIQYILVHDAEDGLADTGNLTNIAGIKGAGTLTNETGDLWAAALEAGSEISVSMSHADDLIVIEQPQPNPGGIKDSSSWGPSWDMAVRPTVLAPGGDILSTWPVALGSYSTQGGTSMSAPLISGIIALIMEARGKDLSPDVIERLLANTAKPVLRPQMGDGEESGWFAPVPRQGNGMVRAYDAAFSSGMTLSTVAIAFNDTEHRVESAEFTVTNSGEEDMNYHISNIPASTAYLFNGEGTSPGRITDDHATIEFSTEGLTLGPGEEGTITVTSNSSIPDESLLPVWSGWISVNASDGSSQRIAFIGASGNLRDHPTLAGQPSLLAYVLSTPGNQEIAPENSTFTLPPPRGTNFFDDTMSVYDELGGIAFPGPRIPFIMASRLAEVDILRASDGEVVGPLPGSPMRWNPRADYDLLWDGGFLDGSSADPGAYRFRIRSLRVFGDTENEDDWDVRETDAFNIEYVDHIPEPGNWHSPSGAA